VHPRVYLLAAQDANGVRMKIAVFLLYAVVGWCAIGLFGTIYSILKGWHAEALKHAAWLAAVGGIYLSALLGVSLLQKQRIVAMGQDQCFGSLCYRVTGVDEVPGLVRGSDDRVLRVRIVITNRGSSPAAEPNIRAYLVDSHGHPQYALPGISGNHLSSRVAGTSETISRPLFSIPTGTTGLGLVLTHGSWQTHQFIIGDSDSLAHKRTIVDLAR
jgi:hypothetical protein